MLANIGETIQSALGLDAIADEVASSSNDTSSSSTANTALDTRPGLDIELGDVGLRHRVADPMSSSVET
jgi:hypothetical protein